MKTYIIVGLAAFAVLASGCDNLQSGRRLRLPKGSVENGKAAFIALKCTECHTVTGVELPRPIAKPENVVVLGGDVARLRSVGDLLTSIIHPTQMVSEKMKRPAVGVPKSGMPELNDVMTVTQLIDLVRFLQPRYSQMAAPIDWTLTD